MSKHTPGPWLVQRDGLGHLAIWSKEGIHLLHEDGGLPLEEREANAELMMSGPELLDLLKDAEGVLTETTWFTEDDRLTAIRMLASAIREVLHQHGMKTLDE